MAMMEDEHKAGEQYNKLGQMGVRISCPFNVHHPHSIHVGHIMRVRVYGRHKRRRVVSKYWSLQAVVLC